jgi:hypothetical protein
MVEMALKANQWERCKMSGILWLWRGAHFRTGRSKGEAMEPISTGQFKDKLKL